MKSLTTLKKVCGGMAATLLLGGMMIGFNQPAFADDDEDTYVLVKLSEDQAYNMVVQPVLGGAVMVATDVSGIEYDDVLASLRDGKSLGATVGSYRAAAESALLQQINDKVSVLLSAERIDSAQAKSLLANAEKQLDAIFDGKKTSSTAADQSADSLLQSEVKLLPYYASIILDKDLVDIKDVLNNGGTLSDAAGASAGVLGSGLNGYLTQAISVWKDNGTISSEEADSLVSKAQDAVQKAMSEPGFTNQAASNADAEAVIKERLAHLVSDATILSEEDAIDVKDALDSGSTLTEATKLTAFELQAGLEQLMFADLEPLHNAGKLSDEEFNQLKQQASEQIAAAIQ